MHYAMNEQPFYFKVYLRNPYGSNYGENDLKIDSFRIRNLNFYIKVNFINESKVQNDKLSLGEMIQSEVLVTRPPTNT